MNNIKVKMDIPALEELALSKAEVTNEELLVHFVGKEQTNALISDPDFMEMINIVDKFSFNQREERFVSR